MRKITLRACQLAGAVAIVLLLRVPASATDDSAFRKTPYLLYTGDPSAMSVLWETHDPQTCSLALCLLDGREIASVNGFEIADRLYRADLVGLSPATEYLYEVTAGTGASSGVLTTAPTTDETHVVFYGISDTQGAAEGADMSSLVRALSEDAKRLRQPTFLLHGGDWIAGHSAAYGSLRRARPPESQWDLLFDAMASVQSLVPTQGVRGNHDLDRGLPTYWPYPSMGSQVASSWAFDFGPVHIIVLPQSSGNLSLSPAQALWLVADVEANRARPWTILLLHDFSALVPSVYGNSNLGGGAEGFWPWDEGTLYGVLAARGVDLILSGHWHCHDFFAVDCSAPIPVSQTGRRNEINGMLPVLTMASATIMDCAPHWYRFEATGSHLRIDVMSADGNTVTSHGLTARP